MSQTPFKGEMNRSVERRHPFERPDLQVKAFMSAHHEGFYVVTAFGFPCFIYVEQLHRWFGGPNDMMQGNTWHKLRPINAEVTIVTQKVLFDIFRRGVAGLVKHRILGVLR